MWQDAEPVTICHRLEGENMNGLIIKKKWLDLIVSGKKTLEIRGSNTKNQNETIYLLESGTHRVVATAVISSTYPVSCSDWSEERENH